MAFGIDNILQAWRRAPAFFCCAALSAFCLLVPAAFPATPAFADEASDVKSQLSEAIDEASSISGEIEDAQKAAAEYRARLDEKISEAEQAQQRLIACKDKRDQAMVALYKLGGEPGLIEFIFSARSFGELLDNVYYAQLIHDQEQSAYIAEKAASDELDRQMEELDVAKDEQEKHAFELEARKAELENTITALKAKADEMDAAQRAAVYASANELSRSQLFDSGDTSGWSTGTASAYGGHSDDALPSNAGTATGEAVTESSMGVAIPMSWDNFRSYYGRKVEISYGGKSVIATVNDCGGMGGGSRVLDLQPGVFRAFGCETCDEWGLREVSYRFL